MRPSLMTRALALVATSLLIVAGPTLAGPTCENRIGAIVRCGTPGALPSGVEAPPRQRAAYLRSLPPDPSPVVALSLAGLIGALFALIALMPDFDGRTDEDWGRQEGDE